MSSGKNTTLELMKLFASYMVVFVHVLFYGRLGDIADALARFAVPLFFLTSGFFSYNISPEKIKKRTKHIAVLFIFSAALYTASNVVGFLFNGDFEGLGSYFAEFLDVVTFARLFIVNIPLSSSHLWYLAAMIYVYIIFYFATVRRFNEKKVAIVSFSLLILHVILGEVLSVFGISLPNFVVRNFALMGIPFFVMGLAVKKYEDKFRTVPDYLAVIALVAGILETVFSRLVFGKNELYVGSLLILFAFVTLFIKYPSVRYPKFLHTLTACSTYIYIFHKAISSAITGLYDLLHVNYDSCILLINIHPVIVCVVSTAVAYCTIRIQDKNRAKNQKTKITA